METKKNNNNVPFSNVVVFFRIIYYISMNRIKINIFSFVLFLILCMLYTRFISHVKARDLNIGDVILEYPMSRPAVLYLWFARPSQLVHQTKNKFTSIAVL